MGKTEFQDGLVSVIIPVYNSESYIGKTIESALAQTYKNFEIIIVDDCSTDLSAQIIQKYCKKYSNIYYYLQPQNQGVAVARNRALELAKGQYVAFLDSDDLWYPDKIERQLGLMDATNTPFSYTAIKMINENDQVIRDKRKIPMYADYQMILRNTLIATSSVVIDRKKIGAFKMPLRRSGQDYATWLMILHNGICARGIDEALVQYRVGRHSLSSNKFKSIKQVWEIQVQNEKISKCDATVNVVYFTFNALKKYLLK